MWMKTGSYLKSYFSHSECMSRVSLSGGVNMSRILSPRFHETILHVNPSVSSSEISLPNRFVYRFLGVI